MAVVLITLKIIAILLTIGLTAYTKLHDTRWLLNRQSKSRAVRDYEFIAHFMQLPIEQRSHLEIEQAFHAWHRKPLRYMDIMAMLNFANPLVAFRWFGSVARFVELGDDGRFVFVDTYTHSRKRKRRIILGACTYFVLSLLAIFPLWYATGPGHANITIWIALAAPVLFMFGAGALVSLDYAASIRLSEKFMKEQDLQY